MPAPAAEGAAGNRAPANAAPGKLSEPASQARFSDEATAATATRVIKAAAAPPKKAKPARRR